MNGIKALDNLSENDIIPKRKIKWKPLSWVCLIIVFIPIVAYFVFNGFPVALSFISMFTDMDNNDLSTMRWNGFENFANVFHDERFWKSWGVTLILATSQFVTLLIALVIAVLLEQKVKGAKVLQIIYFIPYICSAVAVAIMWAWVFSKDFGIVNAVLGKKIDWLNDTERPFRLVLCVYITILWQAPAYGIVMFKAALKNVNPSLYEAASLDGAGSFHRFLHVTLPGIKSVLLFLVLSSVTQGLAVFDSVLVLAPLQWTGIAGPHDVGLTVNYYIYIKGVAHGEMEYAAVMSWFLFIVTFIITYPIIKARNKASEG